MSSASCTVDGGASAAGAYIIRYGTMGVVGQFVLEDRRQRFERGGFVVIKTARGEELGQVLAEVSGSRPARSQADLGIVIRAATDADLSRAKRNEDERLPLFQACERLVQKHGWPVVLLDTEAVLFPNRLVLHYLASEPFEVDRLPVVVCGDRTFELFFNQNGHELDIDSTEPEPSSCGAGDCGSCSDAGGCGGHGSACASCPVSTRKRPRPAGTPFAEKAPNH